MVTFRVLRSAVCRRWLMLCLAIVCAAFAPRVARAQIGMVTVAASSNGGTGIDTGRSVVAGGRYGFTATGSWCSGGIWNGGASCGGPDGIRPASPLEHPLAVESAPLGSLLGRVGNWTFLIGGQSSVTMEASGELYLLMNDVRGGYGDNSGSVQVQVAPLALYTRPSPQSTALQQAHNCGDGSLAPAGVSCPAVTNSGRLLGQCSENRTAKVNGVETATQDTVSYTATDTGDVDVRLLLTGLPEGNAGFDESHVDALIAGLYVTDGVNHYQPTAAALTPISVGVQLWFRLAGSALTAVAGATAGETLPLTPHWDFTVSDGDSHFTLCRTMVGPLAPPSPVQNASATVVDANDIALAWDSAPAADGLAVYDGLSNHLTQFIDPADGGVTLTGLQPNTTYCVYLIGTNWLGASPPTDQLCATTSTG